MTKNFEKFIYYTTKTIEKSGVNYQWYLIDRKRREGVHFHGFKYLEPNKYILDENRHNFMAYGIESHNKTPRYKGAEPIANCLVTCGDCYPDGSSLQASRRLGWINPDTNDDYIWNVLHEYFGYWIEPEQETAAPLDRSDFVLKPTEQGE